MLFINSFCYSIFLFLLYLVLIIVFFLFAKIRIISDSADKEKRQIYPTIEK